MKNKFYIFDVDDTLIATTACVRAIGSDGRMVFRAGTQAFNAPNSTEKFLTPGMTWDFSEFESLVQLRKEPTLPAFKILANLANESTSSKNVYIATARQKRGMLYDWLEENGIHIPFENIRTYDRIKFSTVALWKASVFEELIALKLATDLVYFEDDKDNIAAVRGVCEGLCVPVQVVEPGQQSHFII